MPLARSSPPPAPEPSRPRPRKPGLASTKPERFEHMIEARDVFVTWVAASRVTERDLADWWCCSLKLTNDKLNGVAPLHLGEVFALPTRLLLDFLDEARDVARLRKFERAVFAHNQSHR